MLQLLGNKSSDYRLPRRVKANEANAIEDITKEVSELNVYVVISEVNLIDSNSRGWWLDTGTSRHICSDKDSFTKLVPCEAREKLYMSNAAACKIKENVL